MDDNHLDEQRLRRLIDVGRGLLSQLDPEAVLDEVLETACEITGARYAALGVLDADRRELERFVTRGIDAEAAARDRRPAARARRARRADRRPARRCASPTSATTRTSYGFPPGHPPMTSFLGVPVARSAARRGATST